MKVSRVWSSALLATIAAIAFLPATAHADTYQIFDLGSAYLTALTGITASGTAVLYSVAANDYQIWTNGVEVGTSLTNPGFLYDNGTGCTPTTSLLVGVQVVITSHCNGARNIYGTGDLAPHPFTDRIFDGPNPATDSVADGKLNDIDLNSSGDFVYIANINRPPPSPGEVYQAIDLTTDEAPEPSSILLLGTGLLAASGTFRRRLFLRKET